MKGVPAPVFRSLTRHYGQRYCMYCAIPLTPGITTRDHVIPRHKHKHGDDTNIVLACAQCNHTKGDNDLVLWVLVLVVAWTWYVQLHVTPREGRED